MAEITVLFFSYAADRMNGRQHRYTIEPGTTIGDLYRQEMEERLQQPVAAFMFSVNAEWAAPSQILHDGDEVAVIPPVSGG
ncbi:MAG: MoaD/ThiS family protein [Sulfobacillus acidophilus]|uniref:Molybdopterin synthase sulfur carrier subunit n=1 Tax=Sulfobacillus acidophilus TaxID=53633 RepID=A0A2T2WJL8_9FIRM|nr:MAG: MoaD/ThiS family protein [Sulfobacillus acidophilus]